MVTQHEIRAKGTEKLKDEYEHVRYMYISALMAVFFRRQHYCKRSRTILMLHLDFGLLTEERKSTEILHNVIADSTIKNVDKNGSLSIFWTSEKLCPSKIYSELAQLGYSSSV